jgi:hypothetical protein
MSTNSEPGESEGDQREKLYEQLGKVDDLVDRHRAAKPGTPVLGSLEWQDRKHALGAAVVVGPTMKLAIALDHLIVWSKFYRERDDHPLPGFSHYSLLRPAFESSSQVRWVLDPTVSTETRIGRALSMDIDSLHWRKQVEANMRADKQLPPGFISAEERIAEIEKSSTANGITIVPMPKSTKLIGDMNPGKFKTAILTFWQVTSGVLHAQEWATLLGNHEVTRDGDAFKIIEHTADVGYALGMTVGALHQFEAGLRALESYLEPSPSA